jgi:hypothetical protein
MTESKIESKDIKIINNFLDPKDFISLAQLFFEPFNNFPWFLSTVNGPNPFVQDTSFQFVHTFFHDKKINSAFFQKRKINLLPILKRLKPKSLIRIKANLLTKSSRIIQHDYHTDYKNCTTAIFYINSNNGHTKFKNGPLIKSKENTLIKFNSNLEHAGSTCTDQNVRIVINFNYESF